MFTNHVVMVRPRNFHRNPQTTNDNHFQQFSGNNETSAAQSLAADEFDRFLKLLIDAGIHITVFEQDDDANTPDAIFPNNWFSTHPDGSLILYPMKAENRRAERRVSMIRQLSEGTTRTIDLREREIQGRFLEGTGSMVIDHINKKVFACLSERTHDEVLSEWCTLMGYRKITFTATDRHSRLIYHTNVMLHLGNGFAVFATECISDPQEQESVIRALTESGIELIDISFEQMEEFAGNGLQLQTATGEHVYVLSKRGWTALDQHQQERIKSFTNVITPDLSVIEQLGGGSARCMLAEIFDHQ